MLFDTHAHLDFPDLTARLDDVVAAAASAGVTRIVTIGASRGLDSNYRALDIARRYDNIWCTAGIHPHDADIASEEVIRTIHDTFAGDARVVGIGETGLDYFYDKADRANQNRAFRAFLEMAKEFAKPVIIHSRDAEEDTLAALRETGVTTGILHCFTGSRRMAEALVSEFDFHVSFSGIVTFKNGADLLATAAEVVPLNRILVETDSPYLAPVPHRGKKNEPAFVRHTAQAIADARGISLEELAAQTTQNALNVFGLN